MAEYDVTCAECGVETTVPFKPSGSRPVKCRDCFRPGGGQGRNDRRGGRDAGWQKEFKVTCAQCGINTTVPFRPVPGKEILCRSCFTGGEKPNWQAEFEVTCSECGEETTVPFKPVEGKPVLCRSCFTGGEEDTWKEEFDVTCDECGIETTVPFKPRGDRPVKCDDCYQKSRPPRREGGGGGGGGYGGRGGRGDRRGGHDGERPQFDVTCAECGVKTTVPFKPTGERPVYCRDCFRR